MPHIDYPTVIVESVETLAAQERALRGQPTQARVTMLRLLKGGQVGSLVAVAPLLGYGERTVNRWWKTYRTRGLAALVAPPTRRGGKPSRLSEPAWADLAAAMTRGEIATLRDAQQYLADQHGIVYRSLQGVWSELRRRGVRKKTGRRRHRQASAAAQTEYKRYLRGADPRHGLRSGVGDG